MSKISGSKRKFGTNTTDTNMEELNTTEVDEYLMGVDSEIDTAVAKVREGTHIELEKRAIALKRAKDNKIASADRHRKMQIKNVNLLYEYELEDANALYNKAYDEIQEQMVQELQIEKQRLKAQYKQHMLQQTMHTNVSGSNSRVEMQINGSSSSRPTSNEKTSSSTSSSTARSTRSTLPTLDLSNATNGQYVSADSKLEVLFGNTRAAVGSASSALLAGLPMGGRSNSSRRKPNNAAINGIPPLDQVLSESNMRSDLLEIVRDLQSRASSFEKTKPKALDRPVVLSEDLSQVEVGSEAFGIGDPVCVFSALSQETLSGVVTAMSPTEVVVRVGGGARFAFLISQLRSGRVTLSRDTEALDSIATMRTAVQSSLQHKL